MGMDRGSINGLMQGALGGLGRGLQNYGNYRNPYQQYNPYGQQGGLQPQQPVLGRGVTPNYRRPNDPTNIDPFDPSSYGAQFPR